MSDIDDAVDKVSDAVGEVKDVAVQGAKDVWNTVTDNRFLLIAGGISFLTICAATGGLAAGATATVDMTGAALLKLNQTCAAAWPHIAGASAASGLTVPGL